MGTNSVTPVIPVLRAAGGANMEVRVKAVGTPSPSNSLRPVAGIMGSVCFSGWDAAQNGGFANPHIWSLWVLNLLNHGFDVQWFRPIPQCWASGSFITESTALRCRLRMIRYGAVCAVCSLHPATPSSHRSRYTHWLSLYLLIPLAQKNPSNVENRNERIHSIQDQSSRSSWMII